MKICRLEVQNFGKFNNKILEFSDGINVIYGENESGKSTIMAFVLLMFYGNHGKSQELNKNPRKKYFPWDSNCMKGAIEIEINGEIIRIEKEFRGSFTTDYVRVINKSTGKDVSIPKDMEVGRALFDLDLSGFEKAMYIGNIGAIEDKRKETNDIISTKLSNLVETGDETVSYEETSQRLVAAKERLVSKNRKKGRLVELKQDILELKDLAVRAKASEEKNSLIRHKLKEYESDLLDITHSISDDKLRIQYLQKENKLNNINAILDEMNKYNEIFMKLDCQLSLEALEKIVSESEELLPQINYLINEINSQDEDISTKIIITDEVMENLEKVTELKCEAQQKLNVLETLIQPVIKLYREKNEKILVLQNKKNEISDAIEANKGKAKKYIELNKQRELKRDELNKENKKFLNFNKQLPLEKESTNNELAKVHGKLVYNILIYISLIIIALSAGIIYAKVSYGKIGIIVGTVLLLIGLVQKIKSQTNNKNQLEVASTNKTVYINVEMEDVSKNISQINKEIELLTDEMIMFEPQFVQYNEAMSEYEKVSEQYFLLYEDNKKQYDYINKQIKNISDQATVENVEEVGAKLKNIITNSTSKIQNELIGINCNSIYEAKEKYLNEKANITAKEVKAKLNQDLTILEEKLTLILNDYKVCISLKDKMLAVEELKDMLDKLKNQERLCKKLIEHLGLQNLSSDELSTIKKDLEQFLTYNKCIASSVDEESLYVEIKNKENRAEILSNEISELKMSLVRIEKSSEDLKNEILEKENEVNYFEGIFDSIEIAEEVLEQSKIDIRKNFGMLLNEKVAGAFSNITSGKYSEVLISKDFCIEVKNNGKFISWKNLSSGTIDQAYLALRLGISDMLTKENESYPLLMDDIFIQYDEHRASNALQYLINSRKEKRQLIYFTCHKQSILENNAAKIVKL